MTGEVGQAQEATARPTSLTAARGFFCIVFLIADSSRGPTGPTKVMSERSRLPLNVMDAGP